MEATNPNVYEVRKELLKIRDSTESIDGFGTEALKLAEELKKHLGLLEELTSYNFKHESPYVSDLNYDLKSDFNSWKASMLKYCDQGLVSIIYYLVNNDDPKGFKYFLEHYKRIFDQSAGLKRFLDTVEFTTQDITNESEKIGRIVKSAESDGAKISRLAENLQTTEIKLVTLDTTLTELSNKSALLEGIKNFEETAKDYHNAAISWLIGGITCSIILMLFASFKFFDHSVFPRIATDISSLTESGFDNDTTSRTLYIAFGKYILANLLLVSLLLFLASTCFKNYRSNMHNRVICRHKASSLDSAKKLINNTASPEIHQFILASAANAIFSHQNTGYSENEKVADAASIAILSKLMENIKLTQSKKEDEDLPLH